MTIEELEDFKGLSTEVQAIQHEIDSLYNPVCCPNGKTGGGHSNTPSAPTERAVGRILDLKEKLEATQDELAREMETIEHWLEDVSDAEIRSIIRWHYLLGLDWRRTNMKVYGYPSYYACRKRIMRFFGKEE